MGVSDRDDELLAALRHREERAVDRLLDAYAEPAYGLAVRITGSAHDAEQIVLHAFSSVIQQVGTFRGDSALGTWLRRLVVTAACQKNTAPRPPRRESARDAARPTGRRRASVGDWSTELDDPCLQHDLRAVLTTAIDDLPAENRVALVLHDVEGLPGRELAEILDVSLSSVMSRLHRARLLLRSRLAAYFTDAPACVCLSGAA